MGAGTKLRATGKIDKGLVNNICSYLRRGELRTAKRQRSRPVKRARGPNSSVDGMFQAEEDGGVGLQQETA